MTLLELLNSGEEFDIDVEFYNDAYGEYSGNICALVWSDTCRITEEGIKRFEDVLNLEVFTENFVLFIKAEDEKMQTKVMKFFSCLAGYCSSEDFDKWFTID